MSREAVAALAEIGRARRPAPSSHDPDPLDVLYALSDQPCYAMQKLVYAYQEGQARTGFKIGDTVRVRKDFLAPG